MESRLALTSTHLDYVPASSEAWVRPRDDGYAVQIGNRSGMARDPNLLFGTESAYMY